MGRSAQVLREGFWHSKYEPYLPHPITHDKPWKGQREFLKALAQKEGQAAHGAL